MFCKEAYQHADDVIRLLAQDGLDYSNGAVREEIARAYDEGQFEGNWDVTTDFGVEGLRELRIIQEDEYEQHMDDHPNKPEGGFLYSGYYVFVV